MTSGEQLLPEFVLQQGAEAYIRYCAGLAIVQYPQDTETIHNRPDIEGSLSEILTTAEELMMGGARRIIRASALAGGDEKGEMRDHEQRFAEVYPSMRDIVSYTCNFHNERLEELNPVYRVLQPSPFTDQIFYRQICHGNYQRITTLQLLDGFAADARFLSIIADRRPFLVDDAEG